jgi:S1-C subfamily serine protease
MRQILDFGEVRRGLLGVTIQTMDAESAEALGTDVDRGALITGIEPGSAAEEAGLHVDDIITGIDSKRIDSNRELANAIGLRGSGENVKIDYVRDGRERTVTAHLGQRTLRNVVGTDIHPRLQGAQFATSTATADGGVEVIAVEPGSLAAQRDLRAGDIIIQANRRNVQNLSQLIEVAEGSRILFLLVRRGDRQLMLQIR